MHLLIVSHPCVEPINQQFFARVAARSGWRLTIVMPARWKSDFGMRLAARWPGFPGRILPVPVFISGSVPLHVYRARLTRLLTRLRPQLIYVHHEPYGLATVQVFRANRRAGNVPIGFYSAQNIRKRYPWPVSRGERYVYAHANFAFPVSATVLDVLRQKGYRGRAAVLPLGIDTQSYRPVAEEPTQRGSEPPFIVGYVGRISPEKGLETLFRALELLQDRRILVVVAGDGPATASLKRQASAMGLNEHVQWLGYVPHENTPAVYGRMDVLVVPSRTVPTWKEQFGRVVIEALACGVPVVASDSGELPRLVSATHGGWIFPEGDAPALAGVLRRLVEQRSSLRDRGLQARASACELFDMDRLASRFIDGVLDAAERPPVLQPC